jgi:hypothetical protein
MATAHNTDTEIPTIDKGVSRGALGLGVSPSDDADDAVGDSVMAKETGFVGGRRVD